MLKDSSKRYSDLEELYQSLCEFYKTNGGPITKSAYRNWFREMSGTSASDTVLNDKLNKMVSRGMVEKAYYNGNMKKGKEGYFPNSEKELPEGWTTERERIQEARDRNAEAEKKWEQVHTRLCKDIPMYFKYLLENSSLRDYILARLKLQTLFSNETLLGIKCTDIDFDKGEISIVLKNVNLESVSIQLELDEHLLYFIRYFLNKRGIASDYLFAKYNGMPLQSRSAMAILRKKGTESGIDMASTGLYGDDKSYYPLFKEGGKLTMHQQHQRFIYLKDIMEMEKGFPFK